MKEPTGDLKQDVDIYWNELKTSEKLDIIANKLNIIQEEGTPVKKEKEVKVKFFKPNFGWFKSAGMKKTNKVYVFFCRSNGQIFCRVEPIKDGMIEIDSKCYDATDAFKFVFKNRPAYIVLEWRVHPVGNIELVEAIKSGSIIHPQTITIRRIEKAILDAKKGSMPGWLIWVLVIGGIAVAAYLLMSGAFTGDQAAVVTTTLAGG